MNKNGHDQLIHRSVLTAAETDPCTLEMLKVPHDALFISCGGRGKTELSVEMTKGVGKLDLKIILFQFNPQTVVWGTSNTVCGAIDLC